MAKSNYDNHHRSFPSYGYGDGPTGNNNRSKISNIYDVLASSSDYGAGVRIMQPFDISASSTSTAHTAFKSTGGMAAPLEFPFTFSQREELVRQVRIYKYIMASVPVPLDLLIPIAGSCPSVPVASRFASGRGDVEPGRCKRTDGKKWRCSRDVAPDHKYCERHLHRGRPRSRKPVEHPNKRTRRTNSQALPSSSSAVCTKNASQPEFVGTLAQAQSPFHQNQATWFVDKPSEEAATFWPPLTYKEPRTADWAMNELISMADQQWQMEEPLDLISYPNFNAAEDQQDNSCPWFLNSTATPRGFIDAWSSGVSASGDNSGAEASVSCDGELSLSSLYPTIGINSITVNEMGPIHMGLGVNDYDENRESASKSHLSSWLTPASSPGGPLAEVLRTSATKSRSNPSSPGTGNGNSCSSPVTAVSSPSGVLQKAPTSLSDSCGSSSTTLVTSSVKPEISLMLA